MLIRSVSGVRGLIDGEVTPDVARRYGGAFAAQTPGDIVVGWDSRPGGDVLKNAVAAGIIEAGGRVVDVGVVPTPTVGVIVRRRGLAGGVVITASHNPADYNGLKLVREESRPISGDTGLDDIRLIAEGDTRLLAAESGQRRDVDITAPYLERLLSFVNVAQGTCGIHGQHFSKPL